MFAHPCAGKFRSEILDGGSKVFRVIARCAVLYLARGYAVGQSSSGTIFGVVRDSQNAVIQAMTVENPLQLRCSNNIAVQCNTGYRFVMRQGYAVGDNVAVECQHPFVFTEGIDDTGLPAEGDRPTGKNLEYASDPGFVDAAASDFTLRAVNSIQRDLPGFKPIPLGKACLFVDEFRKRLPTDAALNRFANPDESHGSAYEIKDRGE